MNPARYDIAVAYRLYPGVSRGSHLAQLEKIELAALCLRSFAEGLGTLRAKVWILLDNCPDVYEKIARRLLTETEVVIVRLPGVGNGASFERQLDLLSSQDAADTVYLAEDDYLYLQGGLERLVGFLHSSRDVDFVSGYDHPDHHSRPISMIDGVTREHGGHRWRRAASTCLTFMSSAATLRACLPVFRTFARGNFDASMWMSLTKEKILNPIATVAAARHDDLALRIAAKSWIFGWRSILRDPRRSLWIPDPGLATHLQSGLLSPGIDWEGEIVRLRDLEGSSR